MSLEEYGLLFGIFAIVVSVLLTLAYDNVNQAIRVRLLRKLISPPGLKNVSKQENKNVKEQQKQLKKKEEENK